MIAISAKAVEQEEMPEEERNLLEALGEEVSVRKRNRRMRLLLRLMR
ncbi:MAG: hypothetical protein FWH35_00025 [Treponema sp.]|nr:hypothetical protein [Treponema sp.]